MYSREVVEKSIREMDDSTLISRWNNNMFSEEFRPIAESELLNRGIRLDNPEIEKEPSPVSNFSLDDLPKWKRLFTFKGRASRKKFWMLVPTTWLFVVISLLLIQAILLNPNFSHLNSLALWIFIYAIMIPIIWINWATVIQRLHDRNKSGTRAVLVFIPIIGEIWAIWAFIELGFMRGTNGPNRYGRS